MGPFQYSTPQSHARPWHRIRQKSYHRPYRVGKAFARICMLKPRGMQHTLSALGRAARREPPGGRQRIRATAPHGPENKQDFKSKHMTVILPGSAGCLAFVYGNRSIGFERYRVPCLPLTQSCIDALDHIVDNSIIQTAEPCEELTAVRIGLNRLAGSVKVV